jgi:Ca-activated chloride channel family protein
MLPVSPMSAPATAHGARSVPTEGRTLPLVSTHLAAETRGGLARLTFTQRFRNVHALPLAVSYSLPLPADAAVSGFAITIGARRIVGEIDRRAAARERYEDALIQGRTAGLLEQERSSLFTQELGNVPPGADVLVEVLLDQRLAWLDEGWELRFPTTAAPRYLGESGRVPDAALVTQDLATGPVDARLSLSLAIRDALSFGRMPSSPSHALVVGSQDGAALVTLAADAPLDRDLVLRWAVAAASPTLVLDALRIPRENKAFGLLTLTPPRAASRALATPRDVVVLLDTSGSMSGAPLEQARRTALAIVDTLSERDGLELIEFSTSPRRFRPTSQPATEATKAAARAWLRALRASGGTEMREGILEALRPLRAESQRQVVLVTDGLIGFEREIVSAILETLPLGSRVHTVGVGSAVNRSLTAAAARAGRGLEAIVAPGEDVEPLVRRLVAHTSEPLVVGLTLTGSALVEHAPSHVPDLFAGAPVRVAVELSPHGGDLLVEGRSADGPFVARLVVPPVALGPENAAVVKLFAREKVEDLETRAAAGATSDREIEALGLRFGISTRLTSWVAISEEPTVDPSQPTRRERMPHVLAQGLSAEGFAAPASAHRMAMPMSRTFGGPVGGAGAPPLGAVGMGPPPQAASSPRSARGSSERDGRAAKPSLFERARRALFDDASEEQTLASRSELPASLTEGMLERFAARVLEARIASSTSHRIVLEVLLDADIVLPPDEQVDVLGDSGEWVRAAIANGSTRGRCRAGDTIRFVLTLPAHTPGFPEPITFVGLGDSLVLKPIR